MKCQSARPAIRGGNPDEHGSDLSGMDVVCWNSCVAIQIESRWPSVLDAEDTMTVLQALAVTTSH
jgi:hypothetical protein